MKKVILTKGLPGSGKSTWAKEMVNKFPGRYKRINKDDLRAMLDDSKHSKDNEKFILKVRDTLILLALNEGKDVIIDDTNLASKHEEHIKQLVRGVAVVSIQDFTEIPIETCIKRDLKRFNSVGEKVIRDMYNQFLFKKEVYIEDESSPKAIIVDIDGTLADMVDNRSPFDWKRVGEDKVNESVKTIVNNFDGTVIIFSGRDSVCREETIKWLLDNGIQYSDLFMREEGNCEKDSYLKRRMFEENIRGKYFIEYVIDDRLQVCRMWHQLGLNLLRVGNPDANF